jgi:hypothetical protein
MPRILIRGYANSEHYDATPCLCLDVTPELAKQWLARIAVVKGLKDADDSVYSLDYWNCDGEFFDLYALDGLAHHMPPDEADALEGPLNDTIEALEGEEMVVLEPGTPLYECIEAQLEHTRVPFRDGDPKGARIRTETDLLEVTDNGVVRCGYVKHTSIRVESTALYADDLGKLAGGLEVKPVE